MAKNGKRNDVTGVEVSLQRRKPGNFSFRCYRPLYCETVKHAKFGIKQFLGQGDFSVLMIFETPDAFFWSFVFSKGIVGGSDGRRSENKRGAEVANEPLETGWGWLVTQNIRKGREGEWCLLFFQEAKNGYQKEEEKKVEIFRALVEVRRILIRKINNKNVLSFYNNNYD